MTADLMAILESIIGPATHPIVRDTSPAAFEDGEALSRSRLSRAARKAERSGRYFPTLDADGTDANGWSWGPRMKGGAK